MTKLKYQTLLRIQNQKCSNWIDLILFILSIFGQFIEKLKKGTLVGRYEDLQTLR